MDWKKLFKKTEQEIVQEESKLRTYKPYHLDWKKKRQGITNDKLEVLDTSLQAELYCFDTQALEEFIRGMGFLFTGSLLTARIYRKRKQQLITLQELEGRVGKDHLLATNGYILQGTGSEELSEILKAFDYSRGFEFSSSSLGYIPLELALR